jgi:hypothetical protein
MAHVYPARTADTSLSTGLLAITVSGVAPEKSMRTFDEVLDIGDSVYLGIAHRDANEWEEGIYTYVGTDRFTRTQILQSSASNGPVDFTAGIKDVWVTIPSRSIQRVDQNSFTASQAIIDFGAFPGHPDTSLFVNNGSVTTDSIITAHVMAMDSDDHTADEHWADSPILVAGGIVVGSGFTIYGKARENSVSLYGKYNIAWVLK